MSWGGIRRGSQARAASASSPVAARCEDARRALPQPPRAAQVKREVCRWASSAMSCELRVAACASSILAASYAQASPPFSVMQLEEI